MRAISATSRSVECLKIKRKNFKDKERKVNTAPFLESCKLIWWLKAENQIGSNSLRGKSSSDQTQARAIPVPASKNKNAIQIQIN